jgi:hypothetical protein
MNIDQENAFPEFLPSVELLATAITLEEIPDGDLEDVRVSRNMGSMPMVSFEQLGGQHDVLSIVRLADDSRIVTLTEHRVTSAKDQKEIATRQIYRVSRDSVSRLLEEAPAEHANGRYIHGNWEQVEPEALLEQDDIQNFNRRLDDLHTSLVATIARRTLQQH